MKTNKKEDKKNKQHSTLEQLNDICIYQELMDLKIIST